MPTYVGGAINTGTGGTPTVTHGQAIQEGDAVVLFVHFNDSNTPDTPAGFTLLDLYVAVPGEALLAMYVKAASSSEPASYSTGNNSGRWGMACKVFRGGGAGSTWELDAPGIGTRQGSATADIIVDRDGAVLAVDTIALAFGGNPWWDQGWQWNTADNGYVEVLGRHQSLATCLSHKILASPETASGVVTHFATGSTNSDQSHSLHLSIKENAGVGPPPELEGSGSFAGSSAFAGDGRIQKDGSATFSGASSFAADGRITRVASGAFAGTSSFAADGQISAEPIVESVTPTTPHPGQGGVVISGQLFGATQGTVAYNGITVAVTNWTATAITVTWPSLADGSTLGFNTNLPLIVTAADLTPSAPFSVQTIPDPTYQYVLIGTRDAGLGPGEGLFDDDTLGAGDTYVYGVESPAGGWDFTGLANHYINAVPSGGTFTYRLWDVALGQWSNEAVESFTVEGASYVGSGSFAGSSTMAADAELQKPGSGSFAGASTLAGNARQLRRGSGSFAGASTLQGNGRVSTGVSGSFAGTSAFSADGRKLNVYRDTAAFAGGSVFAGDGRVGGVYRDTASFAGTSALSAASLQFYRGTGNFDGASSFAANGIIPSQTIGPIDKPGFVSKSSSPGMISKTPSRGVIGSQGGR